MVKFLPAALAVAVWGWCARAAAVPPPPEQSAANCDTPTYASDRLVCADAALRALDRRMVELLGTAGSVAPATAQYWFEPQQTWFRRRSLCAFSEHHAACLRAAYRERIDLLSALAGRVVGQGRQAFPVNCPGAAWGSVPVYLRRGDGATLTIEDGRGRVLAVASALQPRDDWSPFLRIVTEHEAIRLEPLGGTVVRCRALRSRRGIAGG